MKINPFQKVNYKSHPLKFGTYFIVVSYAFF